ncbi:MAG: T9SS type A sorting domain-containing protein, partial [Candidatus Krumholzibacteria bacterium]
YFEGVDRIRVIQSHGGPSLIAVELPGVPESFLLHQNYPNPFNPTTTITYSIAKDADVELLIYDVRGALVRTLVQEHLTSNNYKVRWDGKDNAGNGVSTGVYFYRLRAGTFTSTKKMVLLR